jgi:hypothetical protein
MSLNYHYLPLWVDHLMEAGGGGGLGGVCVNVYEQQWIEKVI